MKNDIWKHWFIRNPVSAAILEAVNSGTIHLQSSRANCIHLGAWEKYTNHN